MWPYSFKNIFIRQKIYYCEILLHSFEWYVFETKSFVRLDLVVTFRTKLLTRFYYKNYF